MSFLIHQHSSGLNRWLYALCWTGTARPSVLFDRATAWLVTHKVLLPGVTVLERHVARVRNRVQERVRSLLTRVILPETKGKLEALLATPQARTSLDTRSAP